jgi:autotransporter-associated beta strand protein
MRLSAANTYARGTTISQGTLALGATGSISSSTPIAIAPGALFDVSAPGSFTLGAGKVLSGGRPFSPAADIFGSLISGGVVNIAGQGVPGIFTINGNLSLTGGTLNYDLGAGSSDSIVLTGANRSLTLSGTTSMTPSTGYQPNGTYVLISGFNNLSGTVANLAWGGTSGSSVRGTPLAVLAATSTNVTVTIAGGTPASLLWKGTASGSWDVNTTLNWQNSLGASDTFFNLDSVTFSNNPTTASVTLATNVYPTAVLFNNSSATTYTFSGPGGIGGGTSLTKLVGNGTVYMNVTNTYTGGTTISAGTISLGNGGNEIVTGLGTGPVTLNTGGTLMFAPGSTGNNFNIGNPFNFNGGTNWVEDGKQHLSGSIVNVAAGGATLNNKWGAKDLYIDSQLIGSGPLTLAHAPGGDGGVTGVHFTNPMNTYAGTITVNNSLTPAQVAHPNALANATINMAANNGLVWDGVNSIVLGALSGSGNIANGGGALSVGNNSSNTTYSGVLSGTGSLMKMGTGTFTLSGANTYTGPTMINSGTLRLSGSIGAGSGVTVAGGTLSGTGQIYSPVSVLAGGILSPGGSVGTLTISNTLTLAAGSASLFEISKTGGSISNDLVTGLTGVTFGGALTVTNVAADSNSLAAGDTFKLFNAGGFGGSFAQMTLPALPFGLGWDTSRLTNAGLISVVSVVPTVTSFTFAPGNGFLLGGTGAVSRAYTLQMASNLNAPIAWALVATNVSDTNGVFQFTDNAATNFPQRFYRIAVH